LKEWIAVVGPTGIGKTDCSIELARRFSAHVAAVDSMQVYRGMEIGTGKPSAKTLSEIPHHGLNWLDPSEECDAVRYAHYLAPILTNLWNRSVAVILTGGCGLYLKVLLDGLCEAPGADPEIRDRLVEEGERVGAGVLHDRLKQNDPVAAAQIHPNNLRRVVRALEVWELTGRPLSDWQKENKPFLSPEIKIKIVGLSGNREKLFERLDQRVDQWFEQGWLDEARRLSKKPLSKTAAEAVGYRELFSHLRGEITLEQAREQIKQNTRRYAKRQWTWFRNDPRVAWIETDGLTLKQIVDKIKK
jgi:tRNA dimethylallyltransferase